MFCSGLCVVVASQPLVIFLISFFLSFFLSCTPKKKETSGSLLVVVVISYVCARVFVLD